MNTFLTGLLCPLLLLATVCRVTAQADTALTLPLIKISATPLRSAPLGDRSQRWDSMRLSRYQDTHIAELLTRESGIFVKSYGIGSLATTSVRGAGAGHTAVVWNGFPLQSPMLGLLDLSLLPVAFTDDISLRYGGSSALWGSGAIGGALLLSNRPDYRPGFSAAIHTGLGSFGRWRQHLRFRYAGKRFSTSTQAFHQQAVNDFPYRLQPGLPERRQTNAALQQQGLFQQLYWKLHPRQQLAVHIWWQQADREIPPTTTQTRSEARQGDAAFRTAVHWQYAGKKTVFKARGAWFDESNDYRDEPTGVQALNRFQTAIGEVEGQWEWNATQTLQYGFSQNYTQASSESYEQQITQRQTAVFTAFRQQWQRWAAQISARREWVDGQPAPVVPALGIEGMPTQWMQLKAKITRNYRLPTLNDRYWRPGGKPDLAPERGWSRELTLRLQTPLRQQQLVYSLTGFKRLIKDWILWTPAVNSFFWSPQNIAEVKSRGIEQRLRWIYRTNALQLKIAGGYDYIRSTNEKAIQIPRIEAGEQLAYVPEHQAFGQLEILWKQWTATYQHTYTGAVTTLSEPLSDYQLGFFRLQYVLEQAPFSGAVYLNIENLWNVSYRAVETYAGQYFSESVFACSLRLPRQKAFDLYEGETWRGGERELS